VRAYQLDYRSIPDNSFDFVTLLDVDRACANPLALFRVCYRVLRPDGALYAHIRMITRVDAMMHVLRGVPLLSGVGRKWQEGRTSLFHLQIFTPEAIATALRKSGFFRIRDQSTQSFDLFRGTLRTLAYMRKVRFTHQSHTSDHTFGAASARDRLF
jgi:ubiquinone/menaquinone biosynthesis C-methylase UbiE